MIFPGAAEKSRILELQIKRKRRMKRKLPIGKY